MTRKVLIRNLEDGATQRQLVVSGFSHDGQFQHFAEIIDPGREKVLVCDRSTVLVLSQEHMGLAEPKAKKPHPTADPKQKRKAAAKRKKKAKAPDIDTAINELAEDLGEPTEHVSESNAGSDA